MLAFLTALAEALPAAGKFVDAISHQDSKASTAAGVAADKQAPSAVRDAAVNVAEKAIDAEAAAKKQALRATAASPGAAGAASSASSTTPLLLGLGLVLLLSKRR